MTPKMAAALADPRIRAFRDTIAKHGRFYGAKDRWSAAVATPHFWWKLEQLLARAIDDVCGQIEGPLELDSYTAPEAVELWELMPIAHASSFIGEATVVLGLYRRGGREAVPDVLLHMLSRYELVEKLLDD